VATISDPLELAGMEERDASGGEEGIRFQLQTHDRPRIDQLIQVKGRRGSLSYGLIRFEDRPVAGRIRVAIYHARALGDPDHGC
jgi:hypothetical protein